MLYNIITFFLYFFMLLVSMVYKPLRTFFTKRMCNIKSIEKGNYILIHASSLGEINLVEPFIRRVLVDSSQKIIISIVTDAGFNQAKNKYGDNPNIKIIYFPLDYYFGIKKIFRNVILEKVVIVETELWPNLINYTSKHSKIYLVNGRISEKSFKKYMGIKVFIKPILSKFEYLIMQTDEDKDRIIKLGAPEKKIYNFGNLKFDINFDNYSVEELNTFRKELDIDTKVIVAGSTREGEEEIILEVFNRLSGYKLILVPRHIERVNKIKELLKNYSYTTFSEREKNKDIILVDKMGELRKLYAIADIAFVGGTLVDIGGHSLLEPLYYGKKPIFGVYIQNVRDIAEKILALNLGYKVESVDEFVNAIKDLEKNENVDDLIKEFLDKNSKSSKKSYKLIFEDLVS